MGLSGALIQSVSAIVEDVPLVCSERLGSVEINPLGVSSTGKLMALDGKVTVNQRAIARHSDITLMAKKGEPC